MIVWPQTSRYPKKQIAAKLAEKGREERKEKLIGNS